MSAPKEKPRKQSASAPANGVIEKTSKSKSKAAVKKHPLLKELQAAMKDGQVDTVKTLLASDPDLKESVVDAESKQNLLHSAIRSGGSLEMVKCLVSAGVPVHDTDAKGKNVLHLMAKVKDAPKDVLAYVLSLEGVRHSERDVTGATPLHHAIRYQNLALVTALLDSQGVDLDAPDVTGLTPLHYACHEGLERVVDSLLQKGADASAKDKKGNSPLHYACDTGSVAIGKLLLAKGVNVEEANHKGDTPLHRAVEKKQELMCGWLVNNGADVIVRYSKRLYSERHKISTRKLLRQAAREATSSGKSAKGKKPEEPEVTESESSSGEDLPEDPEGSVTLQDKLDAYGFLIGSIKSNQLQAAEKGQHAEAPLGRTAGPSAEALHELEKTTQKRIKKWVKISKTWMSKGTHAAQKAYPSEKIRKLVYKGIPNHVRPGAWRFIALTLDAKKLHPGEYEQLLERPITKKESHQLDVDINRTNRSHFLFKERYGQGQISLFSILHAYCVYDPVVGYCQGMSDLTALMMQYIEEEEAFWMLVRFMQDPSFNMAGRFQTGFKDLKRAWYVHEKLVAKELPHLYQLLQNNDPKIEATHYTIKWYLKCFLDALSFDIVLRIWDILLFEGTDVLYTFVIFLLRYHESAILALDPAELLMYLPGITGPPAHISVDQWIADVKHHPIKTKLIRQYEAEFDAAYPAQVAAEKAEADRRMAEWERKRAQKEKDQAAKASAPTAGEQVKENGDAEVVESAAPIEIEHQPKEKRKSKRASARKSKAIDVEAPAE